MDQWATSPCMTSFKWIVLQRSMTMMMCSKKNVPVKNDTHFLKQRECLLYLDLSQM